jgi:hypothetical protein
VTPDPGASREDELRQALLDHMRWLVALENSIAHGRKTEARLVRLLVDELRQPRSAGRPRRLFALDLEDGSLEEQIEQVRQVIRLSLGRLSIRRIAEEVGISERQVTQILGEKPAA